MSGSITLNGVTFHPSDLPKDLEKIGVTLVMASGTRRFVQRLSGATPIKKRSWNIPWKVVPEATRAAVEAIALLGTTFAYVDEHGTSYTVQCEGKCYSESVSVIVSNTELYYDVTLQIYEA